MNISGIHVVASGIQRICRVNVDWSGELLLEGAGDGGRVDESGNDGGWSSTDMEQSRGL